MTGITSADWAAAIATFKAAPVTWTVSASAPAGHGTITPASVVVNDGDPSGDFTLAPALGYHLLSLTDNGTDVTTSVVGGVYAIASVTADHTLVAVFEADPPVTFTVSASAAAGHGSITPASVVVNEGDPPALHPHPGARLSPAQPDRQRHRRHHQRGGRRLAIASVTADHTLVAVFEAYLPVTWTVSASAPAGHGTITPAGVVVNDGDPSGDFTLAPALGYHLLSLTDNGTDVTTSVVGGVYAIASVTADHTLVAVFEADPPVTWDCLGLGPRRPRHHHAGLGGRERR